MKFEEHGVYEMKVEGDLLLVDATGPFNEELINSYRYALESCIHFLEIKQWNQIITLHEMSLFTPEAEEALTQSLIDRKSRGLVFCGVVICHYPANPVPPHVFNCFKPRCFKNGIC